MMRPKEEIREIVREELAHSKLRDMPDFGGFNQDHDSRYILKRQIAEISFINLVERSSDPADPEEGNAFIWMSDGTGSGDDGDLMVKITAGGVTSTGTLIDFSGL